MKLAILGTVGVPGRYGGFETLVENLVRHAENQPGLLDELTVYCSARAYPDRPERFLGARLRYSRLNANGVQSIPYDMLTAVDAARRGHDTLLILGVSGAVIIPVLRLFSRARIVINVDGIEWRREKWQGLARHFLRWSERLAVRYAHDVVADNQGIADYLSETYGIAAEVIAYGGDHALEARALPVEPGPELPDGYALALCRIEPENNVEMILEAFDMLGKPLVFIGNWDNSDYGRDLKARYVSHPTITIHDPVYEPRELWAIRDGASMYVHGHSAGGTNPSLVEMMHFGVPILAYDCSFNRHSTEGKGRYFLTSRELVTLVHDLDPKEVTKIGVDMREIAQRRYNWDRIGKDYYMLLCRDI